ncbi:hypothetical protein Ddc_03946 [Ditylenchus destructor]|nr:hypothetical protein Ddc_03946 [Ditylenchus destructor]
MEKARTCAYTSAPICPATTKQQAWTEFRAHSTTSGIVLFPSPATLFRPTQSAAQACLCGCAAALARSQWREAQSHFPLFVCPPNHKCWEQAGTSPHHLPGFHCGCW